MSEVKRKKGESFEAFIRRVKRRWQQSGKLLQAKKVQFRLDKKSKNVRQKQKVQYLKDLSKTEYLRKIGKLPPEEEGFKKFKKRR